MQTGLRFNVPINLIKKEEANNPDYLINKIKEKTTKICIIESINSWTNKKG